MISFSERVYKYGFSADPTNEPRICPLDLWDTDIYYMGLQDMLREAEAEEADRWRLSAAWDRQYSRPGTGVPYVNFDGVHLDRKRRGPTGPAPAASVCYERHVAPAADSMPLVGFTQNLLFQSGASRAWSGLSDIGDIYSGKAPQVMSRPPPQQYYNNRY